MKIRPIDANALHQALHDAGGCGATPGTWADGWDKAITEAIRLLDEAPTLTQSNEWVSVEERLPEKKQDVLMLFDTGNMSVGWWHDADEHITFWCAYTDDGFYTDCDCIPTHWMPLPSPPDITRSNKALTLDELQEMEGQPVYLETGEVIIKEQIIRCWEIVCRITRCDDDTEFWFTRRVKGFWASDYGKTWLAYRRPPEGEEDELNG